jgi:hypothetical protein
VIGKTENHPGIVIHSLEGIGFEHGDLGHLVIDTSKIKQGLGSVGSSGRLGVGTLEMVLDRIPMGTILRLTRVIQQAMEISPSLLEFLRRICGKGCVCSHTQGKQTSQKHTEKYTGTLRHGTLVERCQDGVKGFPGTLLPGKRIFFVCFDDTREWT